MTSPTRTDLTSRESVLMLLSDAETERVSTAEGNGSLASGSDYLDLTHLEQGIQHTTSEMIAPMHSVIPRSAVSEQTWNKIVAHLAG